MRDPGTVAVGLDGHKSSVRLAAVRGGEVVREVTLAFDPAAVERQLRAWAGGAGLSAGPTDGFGLHRHLVAAGIDSVVAAPGVVPARPGESPDADDVLGGVTRRAWLGRQVFEPPGRQQAFDDYRFCVDQIDRRIGALEGEIARLAVDGPHAAPIGRLRCLRGNDTLTAIGPVCEVGDFARFATAEQFMSFVGPVPSERSSGDAHRHRNQDPAVLAARAAAASSACTAAGNGWPAAASPTRRSSSPAPASAPDTSGRSPPTSRRARPSDEHQSSVA